MSQTPSERPYDIVRAIHQSGASERDRKAAFSKLRDELSREDPRSDESTFAIAMCDIALGNLSEAERALKGLAAASTTSVSLRAQAVLTYMFTSDADLQLGTDYFETMGDLAVALWEPLRAWVLAQNRMPPLTASVYVAGMMLTILRVAALASVTLGEESDVAATCGEAALAAMQQMRTSSEGVVSTHIRQLAEFAVRHPECPPGLRQKLQEYLT